MPLNLIFDSWIPVLDKSSASRTIAPWEMADPELLRPDWPRADLNLACLELLIGLVFLADPPANAEDWEDRQTPDPQRLKERLLPLAPAFNLTGDGPLFLQDLEPLEGDPNAPDMLFIDSAGQNTAKKNADLMVHRDRYASLPLPLAAMALYTLQAHAPSGGAGNRTSMRGGGPMVTLIDPGKGLWPLVWANVPDGTPGDANALPWMHPTQTSGTKHSERYPQHGSEAEAFFGMPRRLRLQVDEDAVTGVIQRPYGANYAGWTHPLTPHYRMKEGADLLPKHPKPGRFGYRNWLGVVVADTSENPLSQPAKALTYWADRLDDPFAQAHLVVAGWAMSNMTPVDFSWSEPPLLKLPDGGAFLRDMVRAADVFRGCLRRALAPVLGEGDQRDAAIEAFYDQTQSPFEVYAAQLAGGASATAVGTAWVKDMRQVALGLFDTYALPGLSDRDFRTQKKISNARSRLVGDFSGAKGDGDKAYAQLGLEPATRKRKEPVE